MPRVEARGRLLIELPLIAKSYGARLEIEPELLAECADFVLKKFGEFGIDEIREAYRQHASGEIVTVGAAMYGGQFNAEQLGKILAAYRTHRNRIVADYLKVEAEMEQQQSIEQRREKARAEFERTFPQILLDAKGKRDSWEQIPAWWYGAIKNRGWLQLEFEEAQQIFAKAQEIAPVYLQRTRAITDWKERLQINVMDEEEIHATAQDIARRMVVLEKCLNNKNWQPKNN